MTRHLIMGIAGILLVNPMLEAETPLTVNLAGEISQSWDIDSGRYSVTIVNTIPGKVYVAVASTRDIPMPTLPNPFTDVPPTAPLPAGACADLEKALRGIYALTAEAGVPLAAAKLQSALDTAANAGCGQGLLKDSSQALGATSFAIPRRYVLRGSQKLQVVVTRSDPAKTWTATFSTEPRGEWLTSYGFMFIPSGDEEYFSAEGSTNDEFVITRKHDRHEWDFSPSVFFNFLRAIDTGRPLVLGPTAGLGFDLSAPVVFAGASLFYERNIALVAGAVIHQERRLRGEYRSGQTVTENLSTDQLTEKTYRPGFFIGLSFRFSENIFKKGGGGNPKDEEKEGEKKDGEEKKDDKEKAPDSEKKPDENSASSRSR